MLRTIAVVGAVLLITPLAVAQPLPSVLRSAGVTQTQWDAVRSEARTQARLANVSEAALVAAADASVGNLARSGRFDAMSLQRMVLQGLAGQAAEIVALQQRLDEMTSDIDPVAAAAFTHAREALDEGRLSDADQFLAQAALRDIDALRRAEVEVERRRLRAGEAIAARAQIAALQVDYLGAAQLYARAAETVPQSALRVRWEYRRQQGYATAQRGSVFLETAYLGQAADIYEQLALPLVSRETDRLLWVSTQELLGYALRLYAGSDVVGVRQRALAAYEAALSELTPERDRDAWARIQIARANLLLALGNEGVPDAWQRAEAAYQAVLAVWTVESFPAGNATAQSGLAIARRYLGSSSVSEPLRASVAAAEAAVAGTSRANEPERWAANQAVLGDALFRLGANGDASAFARALAAHDAALTIRTRAALPTLWATSQRDRGRVLSAMGMPDRAVESYDAALTVFTRDRNPNEWSFTLQDLAIALRRMDERGVPGAIEREIATYEAQLGVWTRQSVPHAWASVQLKLAYALRIQSQRGIADATQRARAAAVSALEGAEQVGDVGMARQAREVLASL